MKKVYHSERNLRQTIRILKTCLFFTLLFAGIFTVKAQQKIYPYPLSTNSKDYKPGISSPAPSASNAPASQLPPATGTWTPVTLLAPNSNLGGMLLLSDGSVLVKSDGGTGNGTIYNRLTPDDSGSYANGTWSSIAPMFNDRLYYSSQILKDGRVYVAGGEYGSGYTHGEVYDPLTNTWTLTPDPGYNISDANSEILEDGRVLQAVVDFTFNLRGTVIYNPANNTYSAGPTALGIHNESAWVKLPDNSILFVDRDTRNSERYIPATNTWVSDGTVPVDLYDPYGSEHGGAVLLPNGKALFLGSRGHNAIYTPSGNTSPGTWIAAADFPNLQGTPDAPAAMMMNGKVLCAVSPVPTSNNHFPSPTSFYEYNYLTNTFTQVSAPGGGLTYNSSSYIHNMLVLPTGRVLYGRFGDPQYYIYTPGGAKTAFKPVITSIRQTSCTTYKLKGTGFNGISEGATYGDDWQMNTNYPIVRLKKDGLIYYCRTSNWNSTGVMRGAAPDSVDVALPAGLANGTYSLVVAVNGYASDSILVTTGCASSTISINDVSLKEGNTGQKNINFSVTLSAPSATTVKVNFKTANQGATAPSDYTAKTGTVTFAPGVIKKTVSVAINGDNVVERDETFRVVLTSPVNATIADGTGIGTILNDDGPGSTSISIAKDELSSSNRLVSIAPNPATNIINIQLKGYTGNATLQLTDMQGTVLKETKVQAGNVKFAQQQFNVSGIANGTYFIVVLDEKGSKQTEKVIITH